MTRTGLIAQLAPMTTAALDEDTDRDVELASLVLAAVLDGLTDHQDTLVDLSVAAVTIGDAARRADWRTRGHRPHEDDERPGAN